MVVASVRGRESLPAGIQASLGLLRPGQWPPTVSAGPGNVWPVRRGRRLRAAEWRGGLRLAAQCGLWGRETRRRPVTSVDVQAVASRPAQFQIDPHQCRDLALISCRRSRRLGPYDAALLNAPPISRHVGFRVPDIRPA